MWSTILKLAPMLIGTLSKGVGFLTSKAEANKGATLGGLIAGIGLFSNPTFMNFVAEMLEQAATYIRSIPAG